MMGSFLTRGLAMVFGYAYPAYECYKTVEKNKPEIEQLRFWCQYWILVAVLTVCERVGDTFISWVPMYSEAKVAFFIYLWYPKTKGTTYVYDSFFRPYLSKHETEIDRNLLELRTRAGDIAVLYWEKAANYGQTRVFEILQYFASQSTSRPRPAQMMRCCNSNRLNHMVIETRNGIKLLTMLQFLRASLFLTPYPTEQQQQQGSGARQPPTTVPTRQPATQQQQSQQPPSRTSSTSSTQQQHESAQEAGPPPAVPASAPPASTLHAQTTVASQPAAKAASQSTETEAEAMQIEPVSSVPNGNASSPPQETVMEEVIRVTRARSRKNRAAANR